MLYISETMHFFVLCREELWYEARKRLKCVLRGTNIISGKRSVIIIGWSLETTEVWDIQVTSQISLSGPFFIAEYNIAEHICDKLCSSAKCHCYCVHSLTYTHLDNCNCFVYHMQNTEQAKVTTYGILVILNCRRSSLQTLSWDSAR